MSTLPAAPASGSRYSIVCLSKFHRHGPGQRREDGLAPYQVALRYGHEQAADYLAAGADSEVRNHWGENLLDLAGTNQEVADLLHAQGVQDRDD